MNAIELNAVNYQYKEFKLKDVSFRVLKDLLLDLLELMALVKRQSLD